MEDNNNKHEIYTFSIPKIVTPKFSESGRAAWVNYGSDNLYPQYLVDLMDGSGKHNAILHKKAMMTGGNGWEETVENKEFIKNKFGTENLNKTVFKSGYDLCLYGGFTLFITWSRNRKSIAKIEYLDLATVRITKAIIEKDDEARFERQEEGVEFYYVSDDWSNVRKNKPKLVQGFSEKWNDVPKQIIYAQSYRPGTKFYQKPDYVTKSGENWINLDIEISNFYISGARKNFTPSLLMNFIGNPTDDERRERNKKIKKQFIGTGENNQFMVTDSPSSDKAPSIIPINNNDNDKKYLELEEKIGLNMAMCHGLNPALVVPVAGRLGSGVELAEAQNQLQAVSIDPKQFLLEETFNMLAEINGSGAMLLEKSKTIDPFMVSTQVEIVEAVDKVLEELDIEKSEEEKNNEGNNGE